MKTGFTPTSLTRLSNFRQKKGLHFEDCVAITLGNRLIDIAYGTM